MGNGKPRNLGRRPACVAVLAALILLLSGCATLVHGRGSLSKATDVHLQVHGSSGSAFDQQAENAIADVEAFWQRTYPTISNGAALPPLRGGLWSVDGAQLLRTGHVPADVADEGCIKRKPTFIVDNAAYCRIDDSIIWDRSPDHLVPKLARQYGPVLTALVFAHEFGHAIQQRTGMARGAPGTIYLESQADCAAGAFIASALHGGAPHFPVTHAELDRALEAYLLIRDSTPESPAQISHGDGFDRLNALQQGIRHGAKYCYASSYFRQMKFTERGYATDQDLLAGGNEPLAEELKQKDIATDLNRFWRQAFPELGQHGSRNAAFRPITLTVGPPPCASGPTQLAYCAGPNAVFVSRSFAARAYYSITALAIDDRTGDVAIRRHQPGDYALGALLAMAWGFAARSQAGIGSSGSQQALLSATCDAGAYSRNVNLPQYTQQHPFVLSPPDLDEASSAVLSLVPLPQAYGARGTDALQRIEAFVHGYESGVSAC